MNKKISKQIFKNIKENQSNIDLDSLKLKETIKKSRSKKRSLSPSSRLKKLSLK